MFVFFRDDLPVRLFATILNHGIDTMPRRLGACQHTRPGRCADRSCRVGIRVKCAAFGQGVDVGSLVNRTAHAREITPAEVIDVNDDDIIGWGGAGVGS